MRLFLKVWPYLLAGVLLFLLYSWIYHYGSKHGASEVQAEWNQQKEADAKVIEDLKTKYASMEATHREENTRITHELAEAKQSHAVALAKQRAEYDRRLQLSANLAAIYQRQAEGGEVECRGLASHAARLDQALEEGRHLVRELGETIRLRDQQLISLGQQIKADRNLFDGETEHGTK